MFFYIFITIANLNNNGFKANIHIKNSGLVLSA